jgi:hypothetical protein
LSVAARRLAFAGLVLLAIAFLSYWGLTMAEHAVASVPVEPLASAVEAGRLTAAHFLQHPSTYIVHREAVSLAVRCHAPAQQPDPSDPAMLLASPPVSPWGGGRPDRTPRRRVAGLAHLDPGDFVPAFMLAMFLWVINLQASRQFSLTTLPATGMGLDQHLLLPVLVLAARPLRS